MRIRTLIILGFVLGFLGAVKAFPGSTPDISGKWKSSILWIYDIEQNGDQFEWLVERNNQKGIGTISGNNLSVTWTDATGQHSATGLVREINANGKAMRIDWSNGVVMTRPKGLLGLILGPGKKKSQPTGEKPEISQTASTGQNQEDAPAMTGDIVIDPRPMFDSNELQSAGATTPVAPARNLAVGRINRMRPILANRRPGDAAAFYSEASVEWLARELPAGQTLGNGSRDSADKEFHLNWAGETSIPDLQNELSAKFQAMVRVKASQGKETLADWYGRVCAGWARYGHDFGSPQANSADAGLHKNWALGQDASALENELLRRVRIIFSSYNQIKTR